MEGTVIVWDVSQRSNVLSANSKDEQTFFEKTQTCISRFVQRKIFSKPKDEIGLIVTGSNETNNNLNQTIGGYENIKLMFDLSKVSWQMIRVIEKSIKIENGPADWFDALVVAMDYLRTMLESRKYATRKIILFTTFASKTDSEDLDKIINGINGLGIEIVVINDHVTYPEDEGDDVPMSFPKNRQLTEMQQDSEKIIQKIVDDTSGYFCNFDYAIVNLMYFPPKTVRGTPWNCDLTIGTQLRIKISAYIYITDTKVLPTWRPESALPNTQCKMITEHYKGDEKMEMDYEKVIKGYTYGTSVVPLENEIKPDGATNTCFMCIGFTNENYIVEEYFIGTGTSLVVAQKGCEASEKMMFALVEAMFKTKTVMLVRRIYRNGTQPKLYALYPKYHENQFPCFSMFELGFYENRVYFDFPNLLSKKLEPSTEQLDLVDQLIDKMDLMTANEDESGNKHEMFAFKKTLNPINQYMYRCFAQRALFPNESLAPPEKELLDMFEIPAKLKQNAQPYLDRLKDAFELEEVIKPKFKFKFQINLRADDNVPAVVDPTDLNDEVNTRNIVAVGTLTPMEDFAFLLQKGEKMSTVSKQLQGVVNDLLFKSITEQYNKIKMALALYREESKVLGAYYYNDWIGQFKQTVVSRGKIEFWDSVIVAEKLGLISMSESDTSTIGDAVANEFYTIGSTTEAIDEPLAEDVDVDDLFDDM